MSGQAHPCPSSNPNSHCYIPVREVWAVVRNAFSHPEEVLYALLRYLLDDVSMPHHYRFALVETVRANG